MARNLRYAAHRPPESIHPDEPDATALDPAPTPPELTGPQPVDAYIRRALAENRTVQAARFNVLALKARIPQVTALDDPVVSNTIYPIPSVAPQYSLMGYNPYNLMLAQQFPWFGTLRLRGEAAAEDVKVALAELAPPSWTPSPTSSVPITTSSSTSGPRRSCSTTASWRPTSSRSLRRVMRPATPASRTCSGPRWSSPTWTASWSASVKDWPQPAPTWPSNSTSTPSPNCGPCRRSRSRPSPTRSIGSTAWPSPPAPSSRAAWPPSPATSAPSSWPASAYYPNITLGLSYMDMEKTNAVTPRTASGSPNVGLFVGFNLPVYRQKLEAGVCEAEARAVADAKLYDAERDATYREVKDLLTQARTQRDILELFRASILPKSTQALEAATSDYQAGNVDYVTLITAWREVLQIQLQIAQVEAELGKALASLERTVGVQLNAHPPIPSSPPAMNPAAVPMAAPSTPPPTPATPGPFRQPPTPNQAQPRR